MEIKATKFDNHSVDRLDSEWFGKNWPVVYIINNNKEAYIGETGQVRSRLKNHLANEERVDLTKISIISDKRFNKSAIVDIESKLIEYMSADEKFILQNANNGLRNHDYYEKEIYENLFKELWSKLKKEELVQHDLHVLENSDLFKYSPYKSLTTEQYDVIFQLVLDLVEAIRNDEPTTMLINGEAGTGKTVVAMYIMKLFADKTVLDILSEENEEYVSKYKSLQKKLDNFTFALVVPQSSLRMTLKNVVKNIKGLYANMVIGPSEVDKKDYDLIIVDEAHRLNKGKHIMGLGAHYRFNERYGYDKYTSQLQWILNFSNHQILFFDELQSVRPSDTDKSEYKDLSDKENFYEYQLKSQLRVQGGDSYVTYVKDIFSNNPPEKKLNVDNYEFKIYNNISELRKFIKEKDDEVGLSRMLSGFGYEWISKGTTYEEAIEKDLYDIVIQDERMIWNTGSGAWATSENAVNEVGSIHTIQGFDLNYAGVIIGKEVYFDKKDNKIKVHKDIYQDKLGKQSTSEEDLIDYISNIYGVLLSRGIKGTLIYVEDESLKEHLSQYIDTL